MPIAPTILPVKVLDRDRYAADFEIEFAIVECDAGAPDFIDLAQQHGHFGDRFLGRWLEADALEEALELVGLQRGEDSLAQCGAVRRPNDADPVGQLERTRPAGARDNDHGVAHADGEMAAFAGLSRQFLEYGGRDVHHLDLIKGAGGKREQRPADAVALGGLLLADVAERQHRFCQMERGGVVQAHQFAQFG